jgi:hypothetical protein
MSQPSLISDFDFPSGSAQTFPNRGHYKVGFAEVPSVASLVRDTTLDGTVLLEHYEVLTPAITKGNFRGASTDFSRCKNAALAAVSGKLAGTRGFGDVPLFPATVTHGQEHRSLFSL